MFKRFRKSKKQKAKDAEIQKLKQQAEAAKEAVFQQAKREGHLDLLSSAVLKKVSNNVG